MIDLIGIEKHRDAIGPRHRFFEDFQPFAGDGRIVIGEAGDVAAGSRIIADEAAAGRIGHLCEYDRDRAGQLLHHAQHQRALRDDHVHRLGDELGGKNQHQIGLARGPARLDRDIAAVRPAELTELVVQRGESVFAFRIAVGIVHQYADLAQPLALLRPRGKRPRHCRAADEHNDLAPPHSVTWSARPRIASGTSSPSALAVLRLTINSYLFGACTGRSAGFSPLRIRSTYPAARRNWSTSSVP